MTRKQEILKVEAWVEEDIWICEIDEAVEMKKGRNSNQIATIALINALREKETKVFINKVEYE